MIKKLIPFLVATFVIAQELNVEGDMKVSGNISAENNRITNVADPTSEDDAVNFRTLSNSGMKPTRIYRGQISDETVFNVPADRFWKVLVNAQGGYYEYPRIIINNTSYAMAFHVTNASHSISTKEYWLHPNDNFYFDDSEGVSYLVNIFEYTFSNSGSSQGLDYVEP